MAAANRGGGNQNPAGGGPPARRAWDDVFIFQPGEQMYDHLLQWVTNMLQQQQAQGLLQRQRAGNDVVYNQFAVGQIGGQLIRTVPRGSPMVHCEQQLINMIRQPQDLFIIYTENFTCQMRVGTEKRCNCFFQVSQNLRSSWRSSLYRFCLFSPPPRYVPFPTHLFLRFLYSPFLSLPIPFHHRLPFPSPLCITSSFRSSLVLLYTTLIFHSIKPMYFKAFWNHCSLIISQLRTVSTKYKGFFARLGPRGKSRSLQGLLGGIHKEKYG